MRNFLSGLPKPIRDTIKLERKKSGLCTLCGNPVKVKLKNRSTSTFCSTCDGCSQKQNERVRQFIKLRLNANLCTRCGKIAPKEGNRNCVNCVHKDNLRRQIYCRKKFFDKRARHCFGINAVGGAKILWSLWKQQRGKCALTGRILNSKNSELDHVIPRSKGGTEERSNLRWLHRDVNQAKRALSDSTFITLCEDVVNFIGNQS
jgi:5-methylcytosine-specific restriction endonuclease McrA